MPSLPHSAPPREENPLYSLFYEWQGLLSSSVSSLQDLAGSTEQEFLQIGAGLHDFYDRSSQISTLASALAGSLAGEKAAGVILRLRQTVAGMEQCLSSLREQSRNNAEMLAQVTAMLDRLAEPLESFQKMTKTLRMLGITTKIESSRLGEMGAGFLTLALDVENLSQLVSQKSTDILYHRHVLTTMIQVNLGEVRAAEKVQDEKFRRMLDRTTGNLNELVARNDCGSRFAAELSGTSTEVSSKIGGVVASLQMHDMTRQQAEHVIEALLRLAANLGQDRGGVYDQDRLKKLVVEAGDVCELQAAQLRHAMDELCSAVGSIAANLREVGEIQSELAEKFVAAAGMDAKGGSFLETISSDLIAVTDLLDTCAGANREMGGTLCRVAETVRTISGFVEDIDRIGSEIDLIALNAQIKAAHAGTEGAALGVLAEAIKRLSVEAVHNTASVGEILNQINLHTNALQHQTTGEIDRSASRITELEADLNALLGMLADTNSEMRAGFGDLAGRVARLAADIAGSIATIDIRGRIHRQSDQVERTLQGVVEKARELEPATGEFKKNLQHMEVLYTMASERRIHEALAHKRGSGRHGSLLGSPGSPAATDPVEIVPCGEFGDNVELF